MLIFTGTFNHDDEPLQSYMIIILIGYFLRAKSKVDQSETEIQHGPLNIYDIKTECSLSRAGEESALRENAIYLSYCVSSAVTQIFRGHSQYDTKVKYQPEFGSFCFDKAHYGESTPTNLLRKASFQNSR